MPNLLNKDRNKKEKPEALKATHEALILAQQVEHQQRLKQHAEGQPTIGLSKGDHRGVTEGDHEGITGGATIEGECYCLPEYWRVRSTRELLEETGQRLNLNGETQEQFINISRTPRAEETRSRSKEGTNAAGDTKAARARGSQDTICSSHTE